MEIFLFTGFVLTSLAFVLYVRYDLKASAQVSQSSAKKPPQAAVPSNFPLATAPDDVVQAKEGALASLELLYQQINRMDWQQAVANLIASLKISESDVLSPMRLVEPRHSFPREMVPTSDNPHILQPEDLYEAVAVYSRKTRRPAVKTWEEITEQVNRFSNARNPLTNIDGTVSVTLEERPDLKEKLDEVRNKYPFFNDSQPLHETQLKQIFEGEGIAVHYLEDKEMPLLSLFVEYEDNGRNRPAVIIRRDDVHQALREFLLGHELGHWFLHFDSGFAERLSGVNYYLHSSREWWPLETDADSFAMTALFPTPYLADFENFEGTLSEERLFQAFTKDMEPVNSKALRRVMLRYIKRRIDRYYRFKHAILPVRIPVAYVEIEDVEALLHFSSTTGQAVTVNWVRMNEDFVIIDASPSCLQLFDLSREEIIGKLTPLDLVLPEERELLQRRFKHRLDRRKSMFYYTRLRSSTHAGGRRVAVNSLPILRGPDYAGSIGYLILPEQIPVSYFDSSTLQTA